MKLRIPFWDKVGEGWKQFLVMAGGIQAIWFFIVTPLGIIETMQFNTKVDDFECVLKPIYVSTEIKADFYLNSVGVYNARHLEECKTFLTMSEFTHQDTSVHNCSGILSVTEIIEGRIKESGLQSEQAELIRTEFEVWDEYYKEIRYKQQK